MCTALKVVENLCFLSELLLIADCEGLGLKSSPSETAVCTAVSQLEVRREGGQLAPAVSDRGYAGCLLTVAPWAPRAAPTAARGRPGCTDLHVNM